MQGDRRKDYLPDGRRATGLNYDSGPDHSGADRPVQTTPGLARPVPNLLVQTTPGPDRPTAGVFLELLGGLQLIYSIF